jgi:hypothetical protein
MKNEKLLLGCIVVLLVLNLMTLNHSTQFNSQYRSLQNEIAYLRYQVSNDVSSVSWVVSQIREDAQWWTSAKPIIEADEENVFALNLGFRLKEYSERSDVSLTYRQDNQHEFSNLPAESLAGGYFTVKLPWEMSVSPLITITTSKERAISSKNQTYQSTSVESTTHEPESWIYYYIVTKTDDIVRTSEEMMVSMSEVSFMLFNPLNIDILIDRDDTIQGFIHSGYTGRRAKYKIADIYLEGRKAGRTTGRWPFKEMNDDGYSEEEFALELRVKPEADYDSLYVVLRYHEGLTVEREILF